MSRVFNSLRFRLLVLFLLALAPAFGLALFNAYEQKESVRAHIQKDTLSLAENLANNQYELVEEARQLLIVLAQAPAIREDDAGACSVFLNNLKKNNLRFANILKWDLEGNLVCDANNTPLPHKLPYLDNLYEVLRKRDFTIIGHVIIPTSGEQVLSFGYPVFDKLGQIQSVLFASIHLDVFNKVLTQIILPDASTVTLRDSQGIIIAHYPNPDALVGLTDPKMLSSPSLSNLQGSGTIETKGSDGVLRLYAYTPVFNPSPEMLYLVVGIPTDQAMEAVQNALIRNLLILALATLFTAMGIALILEVFLLHPVQKLLRVTRSVAAGDLSDRVGISGESSELKELATSLDQMAGALEKRDFEIQQAQKDILKKESERTRLLHKVITAHEDERLRVARELHDETSQNLTALMLGVDTAGVALDKDPKLAREYFKRVKLIAGDLLDGTHRLVNNLRPPMLDDLGLVPAIQASAEKQLKPLGIDFHLQVDNPQMRLSQIIETALFRIVQEAFTNIARHAQASNVYVRMTHETDHLNIQIRDDGQGFDPDLLAGDSSIEGFGLRGMKERIRMLDGQFQIETAIGEGAKISIRIPIPKVEGEHV